MTAPVSVQVNQSLGYVQSSPRMQLLINREAELDIRLSRVQQSLVKSLTLKFDNATYVTVPASRIDELLSMVTLAAREIADIAGEVTA